MIVHAPKRFSAKRVKESVSTMDLLPTFLEMATNTSEHTYAMPIQGRSLMPHIEGRTDGHDEVIGEYFGEGAIAPLLMIRRAQYKYVYCHIDPEQLFDLANDLNYAELLQAFKNEALERWNSAQLTQDVLISQRRRRLIVRAMNKGKKTAWDHQPIFDSSEMYMRNHIDLDDLESRSRFPKV